MTGAGPAARTVAWLVATSVLGLLAAEQRSRLVLPVALTLGGCLLRLRPGRLWPEPVWSVASATALGAFALDWLVLGDQALFAATFVLLYLVVNKVHHLASVADHEQLLVVTLLLQLTLGVLAVEIPVVLFVVVYLFAALGLLVQLHPWRERERASVAAHALPVTDRPGRAAWQGGLLAMAVAGAVFVLFPRLGAGTIQAAITRPQHVSGFSDQIDLDDIGRIKENDARVGRVRPLDEAGRGLRLLRVVAFKDFDGRRWRRPGGPVTKREWNALLERYPLATPRPGATERWFQVTAAPLAPGYLPVPERPLGLRGELEPLLVDEGGSLMIGARGRSSAPLTYEAVAELEPPRPIDLSRSLPDPRRIAGYLELPEIDRRIRALAGELVPAGTGRAEAAERVSRHLLAGYRYSLDLSDSPDALAGFLFDRRSGHCELFASAMAVLLRARGVPARVVNGFRVSEWSGIGDYFIIRQSDAHAWVEVYFPAAGWVSFDPTPPDPERSRWTLGLRDLSHVADFVIFLWDRYVLSWSIADQRALIAAALAALGDWPTVAASAGRGWPVGVALALGLTLIALGWRHWRARGRSEPVAVRLYRDLGRRLRRAGIEVAATSTPAELSARLASVPAVGEVAELYVRARFAGEPLAPGEIAAARRALGRLGRELRRRLK